MTGRPLLLVGAGGLAREVLAAVRAIGPEWDPLGFVDDNPATHGKVLDGLPVLGPIDSVIDQDAAVVLCTASTRNQASRHLISERIALPDERYATIVHPTASVAEGTVIGAGTILLAFATITAPQRVGSHVVVMPHTTFTHDDEVADCTTFASRVSLSGSVRVGETAYLGSGAVVREGVTIGAGALIGMGAVVLRDVPPAQVWVGNPARPLRPQPGEDTR